jgi:membrane peptidoglycan carboxypeptidase
VNVRLLRLTLLSLGAGLLLAAIAVPVLALTGGVARSAVSDMGDLPPEFQSIQLPERSQILAEDGRPIAELYDEYRINVPFDAISQTMKDAIIAIEDARFYEHAGVDPIGTARALMTNIGGGQVQGGSTITQQYVKNLLMVMARNDAEVQAAREKTLARKAREARYAVALEQHASKDEILHGYLTVTYFGNGAYGVEAAARRYFGISAADLTLAQSALLAGLVQSPSYLDPNRRPQETIDRRNTVLTRMRDLGMIDRAQWQQAVDAPLDLAMTPIPNGCAGSIAPYFCDYVRRTLAQDPALGDTREERMATLSRAGLTVRTTLDLRIQKIAQKAVNSAIPPKDPSGIGAAIAVVEPGTGRILAMAQNRRWGTEIDRGESQVNYVADFEHGGSRGFQAGSTFKAFVLTAAINQRISPYVSIESPSKRTFSSFRGCTSNDRPFGPSFGPYTVRNVGNVSGTFNVLSGTWRSVNTFYVALESATGICEPVSIAESMGLHNADGSELERVPSFTLGVAPVAPLDMANAFATFAARGEYCPAFAVTKVVFATASGEQREYLPEREKCRQVIDRNTADVVNAILEGVINGSDPSRTGAGLSIGRPSAGKTGTTNNSNATWFVGYTPHLAAAVWVGDPQGRRSLSDITIKGRYHAYVYGGTIAGPIWRSVMSAASRDLPATDFVYPSHIPSGGSGITGVMSLRTPPPRPTSTRTATPSPTTSSPTPTPTSTSPTPDPTSPQPTPSSTTSTSSTSSP